MNTGRQFFWMSDAELRTLIWSIRVWDMARRHDSTEMLPQHGALHLNVAAASVS